MFSFISKSKVLISFILIVLSFISIYSISNIKIDSSSESILLESDPDLAFHRKMSEKYSSNEQLFFTLTPYSNNKFSKSFILEMKKIEEELFQIDNIESINSILNSPLLQSFNDPEKKLSMNSLYYILDKEINFEKAKKELISHPVYSGNLLNKKGESFSFLINLKKNEKYLDLIKLREQLKLEKKIELLKTVKKQIRLEYENEIKVNELIISKIREVSMKYKDVASFSLGGTPIISTDLIEIIKEDLSFIGFIILLLMIFTIKFIFKKNLFIFYIFTSAFFSIFMCFLYLELTNTYLSVVSSNFISLILIMSISISIHLILNFKENLELNSEKALFNTYHNMLKPISFVVITTIIGFISLMFSDIKPIIEFGLIISIGLVFTFFSSFLFLILFFNNNKIKNDFSFFSFYNFPEKVIKPFYGNFKIFYIIFFLLFISFSGISKLTVENSFMNYFDKDTEIYKGLLFIDKEFEGTTPLDIIINLPKEEFVEDFNESDKISTEEDLSDFDDFDDFEEDSEDLNKYWFIESKLDTIFNTHNYLNNKDFIGNVLSFQSMLDLAKNLNEGNKLTTLEINALFKEFPEHIKKIIINPYISIEDNQLRFSTRIIDSSLGLKRDTLLKEIPEELSEELGISVDNIILTNAMLLYNNTLQSLFSSQIKTLYIIFFSFLLLFLILFKNILIATIALTVNIISIAFLFGLIGNLNIPLDIMTITIAAISIGISVDDTIHFIYRFQKEKIIHGKKKALEICQKTITYPMLFTSIIISVGFSALYLSNFIPNALFGLLISISMIVALLLNLILLPTTLSLLKEDIK